LLLLQARFEPTIHQKRDPLGELERSPRSPSRKTGGLLLRGGEGKEGERIGCEGRGEDGREGKGETGKEGKGREEKKEGEGREEGMGKGREEGPLTHIPGSAPGSQLSLLKGTKHQRNEKEVKK